MKFCTIVKAARRRAVLTQQQLAAEIAANVKAVQAVEQGLGTLKTLIPIITALDIPITGLPPAIDLGGRLRRARDNRHLTLQQLSQRSGLSIPTLMGLERNRGRVASLESVVKVLAPKLGTRRPPVVRRRASMPIPDTVAVQLINDDCVRVMRSMPVGLVDLVVTSPPYNAGKAYEESLTLDEYLSFAERWLSCIPRVLSPTGTVFLNIGYFRLSETQAIPLAYYYFPILQGHGLHVLQEITWAFQGGRGMQRRYSHRTERWIWAVKDPARFVYHLDDIRDPTLNVCQDDRNNEFGKNPTDLWTFERVVGGRGAGSQKTHPCQFPVAMIERIVQAHSDPGHMVLDPFGGSGSTAVASLQNGRNCISIEIKPTYHAAAETRIAKLRAP